MPELTFRVVLRLLTDGKEATGHEYFLDIFATLPELKSEPPTD